MRGNAEISDYVMGKYIKVKENLRKRGDINWVLYSRSFIPDSEERKLPKNYLNIEDTITVKQITCAHFGCPRKLSLPESLCGNKCIDHQKPKPDIMNCISI